MTRWRAAAALLASLSAACSPPPRKLPSGPGPPARESSPAPSEPIRACRAVSTTTAAVGVSDRSPAHGSGRGFCRLARTAARLGRLLTADLHFVAENNDATLLLTRDGRVLEHGRPGEVLEAVTGLPLDPSGLRETLTGCASPGNADASGRQLGEDWRVVTTASSDLYLHRDSRSGPWRLVAEVHHDRGRSDWRAEYRDFRDGLPSAIRLTSRGARSFDLRLALSQVETNAPLPAAAFQVRIPPGTTPMDIDELRDSGPLSNAR